MSKKISTYVNVVSVNHITQDEIDAILEVEDADSLEEVLEGMEDNVAAIVKQRLFNDADEVPILEVTTEISDE